MHTYRFFSMCLLMLALMTACRQAPTTDLPALEWTGADEAPAALSASIRIASPDEPGERLVLTGTVYQSDGVTPASDILIYAYHTNNEGVYPKRGDETGNGQRHGYLRGWLRTDADGSYRIESIRPMPYPGRSNPAHIHMTIKEPGRDEYWIDSVMFDDDPLLTDAARADLPGLGGSGIIKLTRDDQGTWHGARDIVLMAE